MERVHYTTPAIKKGKVSLNIPKGSNKEKELAKNSWYIEYRYNGKQIRIRPNSLNRIKDHKEKQYAAEVELATIKIQLEKGYNPFEPDVYTDKLTKDTTTFQQAIMIFLDYHQKHQSKPKTISGYKSKLNALSTYLPTNIILSDITLKQIENFAITQIENEVYSQNTLKFYKRTISAFYNVMIREGYTNVNTFAGFNNKIKSYKETTETHSPYNQKQLTDIMAYLDTNDAYSALFTRFIYFTCLRPSEIRTLKVKDINLTNRTLTIRAINKKNTSDVKDDTINLPKSFIPFLEKLNLDSHPKDFFVFGSTSSFISKNKIGENTPYNRFVKCLTKLNLEKQGYDLYSIKHTSNINRWRNGWLLDQIMVANRHTNVNQTLTYLRKINKETDIKDLDVPSI